MKWSVGDLDGSFGSRYFLDDVSERDMTGLPRVSAHFKVPG